MPIHSKEEIRNIFLNALKNSIQIIDYGALIDYVAGQIPYIENTTYQTLGPPKIHATEEARLREIFWDFFRQGIITLGIDSSNRNFPFFQVTELGKNILSNGNTYFFHDMTSYTKIITDEIPDLNPITKLYLQEAMQSFLSGCILSSTVMIGVAMESCFLSLSETLENNPTYSANFSSVFSEWMISKKINKFLAVFNASYKTIISRNVSVKQVLNNFDNYFLGIASTIRDFRNDSGHPSGNIISREQCYVLLNLFIPYSKKIYELIDGFKNNKF